MLFVFHLFLCTATRKRKNSSSLDSYEDPKKTNYGSKPMLEKVSYSLDLKDDQKCYNASKQEEYSVDKIDYYVKNDVSLSDACVNIRVRGKIFNENSELTTEDAFLDSIELQEEDSRLKKHTIVPNLDCFFIEENSFNLEPDSPLSNSLLSLEYTKNGVNELYKGDNNGQIVIADNYTSFITNEKEKIDNSNVTNNQILSLDMHNYFNKDGNVEENVEEFKFSDCDLKILQILDEPIKRYKIIRNVSPSIDKDKHKFCIEFFYYKLRTITNKIKTISKKYSELDDDSYCFYKAIENLEGRFNLKFHRFCNLYVDELRNDSVEILRDHAEHNIKLNLKFFSSPLGNFKYEREYCNDPNIKLHVYDIIIDFNSFLGNYIAKEGRIFTNTYYFGTQYYFKNRSVDARGYYLTILLHFLFDEKNETFILLIPDMYFLINQLINTDFGTSIISKFGVIITKMAYRFEFIKLQLKKEIKTSSNLLNAENLDDIPTISAFILECKLIITCFYLYNLKKNSNVLKHVMFSTFLTFTKIYYKNKFNYLGSRELIYSYFFNFDLDFSNLKLFKETFIIKNNLKKNTSVSIFKSSVFNEFLDRELKKSINLENFKRTNKIKINKHLLNLITEEDIDLKEINEGFPKLNQKLNTFIIQKLKDILYNCDD